MNNGMAHLRDYRLNSVLVVDAFKRVSRNLKPKNSPYHETNVMIEALFLRLVTEAETVTDELFWSLMSGQCFINGNVKPYVTFYDENVARRLIARNRYLNWLPVSEVPGHTGLFFRGINPFARVDDLWKDPLFRVHKVRNFVAHRSSASTSDLDFIPSSLRPRSNRDTVARYLSSTHREAVSIFEHFAEALDQWIYSCCKT